MGSTSAKEMLAALREGGMRDHEIAAATGLTQPTIHRIRNGVHAEPTLSTWQAISQFYLKKQAEAAAAAASPREGGHAAP